MWHQTSTLIVNWAILSARKQQLQSLTKMATPFHNLRWSTRQNQHFEKQPITLYTPHPDCTTFPSHSPHLCTHVQHAPFDSLTPHRRSTTRQFPHFSLYIRAPFKALASFRLLLEAYNKRAGAVYGAELFRLYSLLFLLLSVPRLSPPCIEAKLRLLTSRAIWIGAHAQCFFGAGK